MPWELEPRVPVFLVFVKGTFDLAPRECPIAAEQAQISGEVPFDDVEAPSVRCESDFALIKPRGEWWLTGAARAPGGKPVTLLPVSVRIGDLEKSIVVHGDRRWEVGLLGSKPSAPRPFTELPLRWERSFGGPKVSDNPVGCGTVPVETPQGRVEPLPNIEAPQRPIVSREDRPPPIGLAPIPGTWRVRTSRMGTFDEEWKATRWPFFPRDFDPRFYQAAPPDQQLRQGFWRGDERIVLRGLHPEHAVLETRLPGVRSRCFVEWKTETSAPGTTPRLVEVPLALDTISIDSSMLRVSCVWRGLIRGVRDVAMSNVERLFFLHEALADAGPHEHYERWLARLLEEDAQEAEQMEAEGPVTERPPPGALPPAVLGVETAALGVGTSVVGLYAAIGDLLEAEEQFFDRPRGAEVREALEAAGEDVPDDLEDPEPVVSLPSEELPPSLLRLAAILRKRAGRPFAGVDITGAPYRGLDLRGVDFRGSILADADFTGARLDGALFDGAILQRARLTRASLTGASLEGADFAHADLSGAKLKGARLVDAVGTRASFAGADLDGVAGSGLSAEEADLSDVTLRDASLARADLSRARLDRANLTGATLEHTNLSGASAKGANFERCHAADLRASERVDLTDARFVLVEAPNAQFQEVVAFRANFSGSNLRGADFSDGVLCEANLVRCELSQAKFPRADLKLAQVLQSNLFEADLEAADLRETDLRGSSLFSAQLWRARTEGARLAGAELGRTHLEGK